MIIVADQNIPRVEQAFATLGEVRPVDGRRLSPEQLAGADVLLVRSVTRVDARLLGRAPVQFVGSATSGLDHVDRDWLAERSIGFAHAPGVNAQAVAEYVASAMLTLAGGRSGALAGRTLGIVGCGHVGRRVARLAEVLGLRCLINDPPLAEAGGAPAGVELRPLREVVENADILSLHLPLNIGGPYDSHHLVDRALLSAMRRGAWLINTARGPVVDSGALNERLAAGDLRAVLDVWENEPALSPDLLRRAALGTPHIAGYSVEAKYNATSILYRAACRFFGREPAWENHLPGETATVDLSRTPPSGAVGDMVKKACDIAADDAGLRALLELPAADRAARFDRLRAEYPVRREFAAWRCVPPGDAGVREMLEGLGFECVDV